MAYTRKDKDAALRADILGRAMIGASKLGEGIERSTSSLLREDKKKEVMDAIVRAMEDRDTESFRLGPKEGEDPLSHKSAVDPDEPKKEELEGYYVEMLRKKPRGRG